MTITALFYRFCKEENIYVEMNELLSYFFLRIDNLDSFLLDNQITLQSMITTSSYLNNVGTLITKGRLHLYNHGGIDNKWAKFKSLHEDLIDKDARKIELTLATDLVKVFIRKNKIGNGVLYVLNTEHGINEIKDNIIDELLFKHGVCVYNFFQSFKTFGRWGNYSEINNWSEINCKWNQFLEAENILKKVL